MTIGFTLHLPAKIPKLSFVEIKLPPVLGWYVCNMHMNHQPPPVSAFVILHTLIQEFQIELGTQLSGNAAATLGSCFE